MPVPKKIDLVKENKTDYTATKTPKLVEIKKASYLTVVGQGAPGGDDFTAKIGALYGVAYTVKMTRKFSGGVDYVVSKLEGQWWSPNAVDDPKGFSITDCHWKLMIRTPDFVKRKELAAAVEKLEEKGKGAHVREVKLESIALGRCVQMLHVGPYEQEPESVAVMKAFVEKEELEFHGRHHEVYLSDPRRVPPERLKTILRLPVRKRRASGR